MNLSRYQRFLLFSWNFPKLILLLIVYFYLELQQPSAPIKIPVVLSLPLQVRCKHTQTSFNQIYFNANRISSSSSSRHHRLPSPGPPPKYRKHSESPIAVERFRYSQSHSPVLKNGGHRNGHRSRTPESRMIEHRRNRSPSKAPVSSSVIAFNRTFAHFRIYRNLRQFSGYLVSMSVHPKTRSAIFSSPSVTSIRFTWCTTPSHVDSKATASSTTRNCAMQPQRWATPMAWRWKSAAYGLTIQKQSALTRPRQGFTEETGDNAIAPSTDNDHRAETSATRHMTDFAAKNSRDSDRAIALNDPSATFPETTETERWDTDLTVDDARWNAEWRVGRHDVKPSVVAIEVKQSTVRRSASRSKTAHEMKLAATSSHKSLSNHSWEIISEVSTERRNDQTNSRKSSNHPTHFLRFTWEG